MKKYPLLILGILFLFLLSHNRIEAYSSCLDYGPFAYEDYSGYCKCSSGYVMSSNVVGEPYCVSGDSVCWDKYGYNSTYDSLNSSCKCRSGYTFGKNSIGQTECVSYDSVCKDDLGFNSRYNSLKDVCECSYGYIINGGQCVNADSYCSSKYGSYSSYDSLSKSCECDDGYTLDDYGRCVEKQNNVYFLLKELDTDSKLAIIKSDYDYKYYLISYGSGCYSNSFRRYLNKKIVVNLGTDFYVDRWDKVVLQDDNEVCDIRSVEKVDSLFTLQSEEEEDGYYYVPSTTPTPASVAPTLNTTNISKATKQSDTIKGDVNKAAELEKSTSTSSEIKREEATATEVGTSFPKEKSFINKIADFFRNIFNF